MTLEGLRNKRKKPAYMIEARRDFSHFELQVVNSWEKAVEIGNEGTEK